MNHKKCLMEAIIAHEESGDPNRDRRIERAVKLSQYEVFSKRALAAIVGVAPIELRDAVNKATRTGGSLNPATLQLLLEAIELRERGEDAAAREYVQSALQSGTSVIMASRLTGLPEWRVREWKEQL